MTAATVSWNSFELLLPMAADAGQFFVGTSQGKFRFVVIEGDGFPAFHGMATQAVAWGLILMGVFVTAQAFPGGINRKVEMHSLRISKILMASSAG